MKTVSGAGTRLLAERVAAACEGATAFTLYGGYASQPTVHDPSKAPKLARLPAGHEELRKVNDQGRVCHARYRYADDSQIEYRWSDQMGPALKVTRPARLGMSE